MYIEFAYRLILLYFEQILAIIFLCVLLSLCLGSTTLQQLLLNNDAEHQSYRAM